MLLFGATGAIGRTVLEQAKARGWLVTAVTRGDPPASEESGVKWQRWDVAAEESPSDIAKKAPFDAVCWAQGANMADSLFEFDAGKHLSLYEANVMFVLRSAAALVEGGVLQPSGARLVVVSSIWQERARENKLSYAVTKAAIGGLVRAASADLGRRNHLINAVLPGVLDTPMTRANLTPAEIEAVSSKTTFGRLPDLATLGEMILFLCSRENNAITGQSITIDLGMSNAILI